MAPLAKIIMLWLQLLLTPPEPQFLPLLTPKHPGDAPSVATEGGAPDPLSRGATR